MNINGILLAILVIGILGLIVGLFLGVASIWFHVDVDEREEAVLAALPGNNCGGCGFAGCAALAAAIAKGEAPVNACPVGGEETGHAVAAIMGVEAEVKAREVAFVRCQGNADVTKQVYDYTGEKDCAMMAYVPGGGPKSCDHGCLGFGNCVKACEFDAIHIINGVALVDEDACKACGQCIAACPKHLITLVPYKAACKVACSSKDMGPVTIKACDVGCIACKICEKNCPAGAITVNDFHAEIDYAKCTGCGLCKEKCPKKAII